MDIIREISANLSKQQALLAEAKKDLHRMQTIQTALQETLNDVWSSTHIISLQKSQAQWKIFVDLAASGRILSVAARANEALTNASSDARAEYWIGDGKKYARWLASGISKLAKTRKSQSMADSGPVAQLCGKSFYLGYRDEIVAAIVSSLLLSNTRDVIALQGLLQSLQLYQQRIFVLSTIDFVARQILPHTGIQAAKSANITKSISGSAALLHEVVSASRDTLTAYLSEWLLRRLIASTEMIRAIVAAMSDEEQEQALEQSWTKFSEKMFIQHASVVQQEQIARALLLLAGAVHRHTPMAVFVLAHSSTQTEGTSARLNSTSPRVRFLGMAVATTISQHVDKPETKLNHKFEGEEQDEYNNLNALFKIEDGIGSLDDVLIPSNSSSLDEQALVIIPAQRKAQKPKPTKSTAKIQVVEEDDDDDLLPHAKPDSDPEDEDEDPTLVQRKKPKAPVYIRDLITQLSNTEDANIQELALKTGPSLIRRKADFGSELSDRAIELCATYMNLSDSFNLDDFLELRLQGITALLIAQPQTCGPYMASTIFEGDYNISQRIAALTAMGMAARELAGHRPDNEQDSEKQFPSKTLPERLHKLYLQDSGTDQLSKQLSASMLSHVSTAQKRHGRKIIRNDLSKIVADCFFFPLSNQLATHNLSFQNAKHILPVIIKTLAIILTSTGPFTLSLPQLTAETFSMLLSFRTRALKDSAILEAVLFGFLSVINVNEDKRTLAERHPREVVEVHEWCNTIFERFTSGLQGVSEEEERMKTLCAGVLVATKEVIEKYERLMVGDLMTFGQ
ncbi:MAG: hypothetical protein Q9159_000095 [Coniocarpon cinnabarinum]